VIGLRAFNIVLVGKGFAVEQVNAEDFSFNGSILTTGIKIPQVLQASVDEYVLQLLPDRFQVQANASKATQFRVQALVANSKLFVDEFASKRSILAVGNNFSGAFGSPVGDAAMYMGRIAWPSGMANALSSTTMPTLSWSANYSRENDDATILVRLEPLADDPARIFYDINVSWGNPAAPSKLPVFDLLDRFSQSAETAAGIVDGLTDFGAREG